MIPTLTRNWHHDHRAIINGLLKGFEQAINALSTKGVVTPSKIQTRIITLNDHLSKLGDPRRKITPPITHETSNNWLKGHQQALINIQRFIKQLNADNENASLFIALSKKLQVTIVNAERSPFAAHATMQGLIKELRQIKLPVDDYATAITEGNILLHLNFASIISILKKKMIDIQEKIHAQIITFQANLETSKKNCHEHCSHLISDIQTGINDLSRCQFSKDSRLLDLSYELAMTELKINHYAKEMNQVEPLSLLARPWQFAVEQFKQEVDDIFSKIRLRMDALESGIQQIEREVKGDRNTPSPHCLPRPGHFLSRPPRRRRSSTISIPTANNVTTVHDQPHNSC